jgi:hypothetical protein
LGLIYSTDNHLSKAEMTLNFSSGNNIWIETYNTKYEWDTKGNISKITFETNRNVTGSPPQITTSVYILNYNDKPMQLTNASDRYLGIPPINQVSSISVNRQISVGFNYTYNNDGCISKFNVTGDGGTNNTLEYTY